MPCHDSSASLILLIDTEDRLADFTFTKIVCARPITTATAFKDYCRKRSLNSLLALDFKTIVEELGTSKEEDQFILYLEWDCLRCAIAQYLGYEDDSIDRDRCQIVSIQDNVDLIQLEMVVLPPKDMPKIHPCSVNHQK